MINKFKIPDDIYSNLLEDIKSAKNPSNRQIMATLLEEYTLDAHCKKYENFILKTIGQSNLVKNLNDINILHPNSQPLILANLWVNFQKRYEFQSPHNHGGICSFILFMKIPYLIEDEQEKYGNPRKWNLSGHIQFLEIDPYEKGNIKKTSFPVDKTWEKTGLLFRSDLHHTVFPFCSTDENRITISGNVYFGNENE